MASAVVRVFRRLGDQQIEQVSETGRGEAGWKLQVEKLGVLVLHLLHYVFIIEDLVESDFRPGKHVVEGLRVAVAAEVVPEGAAEVENHYALLAERWLQPYKDSCRYTVSPTSQKARVQPSSQCTYPIP